MRRLAVFVCSFGYIGFPVAPGTIGSAAGVAVYLAARHAALPYLELVIIVALAVAGTALTRPCEEDLAASIPVRS
jgi:hypothetical protein